MYTRKIVLAICIVLIALCGTALAQEKPIDTSYADCVTLCNMDTSKVSVNNPYTGLNVPLNGPRYAYYSGTVHPALSRLGYRKTACGEGGCTYVSPRPVDCSKAMQDVGHCNFPNNNGVLKSGAPACNINWIY